MTKFALDTQIAAQPASIRKVLKQQVPTLDAERPLIFSGIGTSWHACHVAAHWLFALSAGRIHAVVLNAHDLAMSALVFRKLDIVFFVIASVRTYGVVALLSRHS
jgi:glutamine---fructose-6-phosphate transaminase (isomerizing)